MGDFLGGPSFRDREARIRSSASSSLGGRGSSTTSRHDGSASAAESSCGGERSEPRRGETSWYALDTGGWRDYVTLLHLPYTSGISRTWHRGGSAPRTRGRPAALAQRWRLSWARGRDRRPRTRRAARTPAADEDSELRARGPGRDLDRRSVRDRRRGRDRLEPWIALLVPVGVFLVLAYNLELLEGRFHSDLWFGLAWGGFPVVCGYAAVAGDLSVAALLAAAFAVLLSLAQRALSNHVRFVRRARRGRRRGARARGRLARAPRRRLPHRGGGAWAAAPRGCVRGARGGSRRISNLESLRDDSGVDPARSAHRGASRCAPCSSWV